MLYLKTYANEKVLHVRANNGKCQGAQALLIFNEDMVTSKRGSFNGIQSLTLQHHLPLQHVNQGALPTKKSEG